VLVESSVGIAPLPASGIDPTLLLRRADAALSYGRQMQRAVQTWQHDLDMSSGDDLRVLTDLRHGISDGQLRLWYQIKVDAGTAVPRGVEALIRWEHPTRGLLTPDAFIAKAERSALITDLTRWVLADAIAQSREWIVAERPMPVSVNVSAQSLADDTLPATVAALLSTYQVPAGLLTIEVTETAVMADPVNSARRLATLRRMGVRISIDDFGVGNTSLSLLTTLPIDELKLDRSFVARITDSPAHAAVVRMIAALGRELGVLIVAEGVEDEATADALRRLDFDLLQGYLYARPVPATELPIRDELTAAGR
jgi:EAL domain-containing protein (putative c-di-GMP-specific phosphodiesterase class I)